MSQVGATGTEEEEEEMDWVNLAQDRDQWRVLMNTIMNLWIAWEICEYLSYWQLLKKDST
jgi:hypothetical protein